MKNRTAYPAWAIALISALMVLSSSSSADSLDQLELLTQAEFKTLSENVAAATHYKSLAPAEPLGTLGFDVALELSSTDIDSSLFDKASAGGYELDTFLVPRLHVHKGLPFNIDLGASLTAIPDTDFRILGAEVRYAILEGTIATPALAVRLTHSRITGVDEFDLDSTGAEITVSKGFVNLTPYAGAGVVRTNSNPDVGVLSDESFTLNKLYAGLNINLGLNFGLEVDKTGDYESFSIKAGLRF
ncbi:MAG: hypothetical protein KTR33_14790 [Gammaproteobacteria bacterium]|nr:hypothetical protein [Gammaproteobacteria bacterium]